jgi:hypothetical protein
VNGYRKGNEQMLNNTKKMDRTNCEIATILNNIDECRGAPTTEARQLDAEIRAVVEKGTHITSEFYDLHGKQAFLNAQG